jgi:hypothetical protein
VTDSPYAHTLIALAAPTRFSRSTPEDFIKALDVLARHEAEGLVTKTEHDWLKAAFNNAFEKAWQGAVREPFFNTGRWKNAPRPNRNSKASSASIRRPTPWAAI